MVDMVGDLDRLPSKIKMPALEPKKPSQSGAELRFRAAMVLLCPQHPNKYGSLILRAAMGWHRDSEIVLCEANKLLLHLENPWTRYVVPSPPHFPDPEKIRQLFLEGMLKRRRGPTGLFMLYHINEIVP
jgi:hypothetical protein